MEAVGAKEEARQWVAARRLPLRAIRDRKTPMTVREAAKGPVTVEMAVRGPEPDWPPLMATDRRKARSRAVAAVAGALAS